jgi:hypothetical protein
VAGIEAEDEEAVEVYCVNFRDIVRLRNKCDERCLPLRRPCEKLSAVVGICASERARFSSVVVTRSQYHGPIAQLRIVR